MRTFKTLLFLFSFIVGICVNIYGQFFPGINSNFGFTSYRLMIAPVKIRDGADLVATKDHVYYIGTNNKVCDYFWNGTSWANGTQLDWSTNNTVQYNTQICNNGNELFFVRASDNQICQLIYFGGSWRVNKITTIPAREGTNLIYDNNVIYYVGKTGTAATNNKVCFVSRPNSGTFNSNHVLSSTPSYSVLYNSQIIYVGPNANTPAAHVYYIGDANRAYDIVNNTGTWQGSTDYLGSLGAPLPKIRSNSNLTNNENQLFYVGVDNKIYELHWKSVTGWTGSVVNANAQTVLNSGSPIKYFDNHVYYVGSTTSKICDLAYDGITWCCAGTLGESKLLLDSKFTVYKGTTGHVLLTIGIDHFVKLTLWDDKVCLFSNGDEYCSDPGCQGATWHNGTLGALTSKTIADHSNIAVGIDPLNPALTPKTFFYYDMDYYANIFVRSIKNDINRIPWPAASLTFQDEFNDKTTTMNLWDSQGPWSHGNAWPTNPNAQPHASQSYPKTNWNDNFDESNNEYATISVKQENYLGHTWGWATGPDQNSSYCDYITPYPYTSAMLCTGGINLDYQCADPWVNSSESYCTCGMVQGPQPFCQHDKKTNTCDNYIQRYSGNCYPNMSLPKFQQAYGWFEIRCKVPSGKNIWSSFWSLNKGSGNSEIDFFEIDGDGKTMLSNVYYEDCVIQTPDDQAGALHVETYAIGYRFYDDFYTYACEWGPNGIGFYLNNEFIGELTQAGAKMQKDEFFLLINAYVMDAVGKCGSPNFPTSLDIDYVRVYQNPSWRLLSQSSEATINGSTPSFSTYPTIPEDLLNIKSLSVSGLVKIEIINSLGEIVNSKQENVVENSELQIKVNQLPKGLYNVRITSGAIVENYKIIKI